MHAFAAVAHALAALFWVGGMFFAYVVLRPAATVLDPRARAQLWGAVLSRFFPWVWLAIGVLLASGLWMLIKSFGGFGEAPVHVLIMFGVGLLMMLIFGHVYAGPYRRLRRAVDDANWEAAAERLNQIRGLFRVNLVLGVLVVIVAVGGRYF